MYEYIAFFFAAGNFSRSVVPPSIRLLQRFFPGRFEISCDDTSVPQPSIHQVYLSNKPETPFDCIVNSFTLRRVLDASHNNWLAGIVVILRNCAFVVVASSIRVIRQTTSIFPRELILRSAKFSTQSDLDTHSIPYIYLPLQKARRHPRASKPNSRFSLAATSTTSTTSPPRRSVQWGNRAERSSKPLRTYKSGGDSKSPSSTEN
ncbi:hypothetical protein VTL71DRAFT_1468 [Oculimacula yallundae]|uniref:Uncharacterized protein n=1 Tax=Oculimacula yallundae TaxID=86028 RepID=A0ABR4CAR5_9HELO